MKHLKSELTKLMSGETDHISVEAPVVLSPEVLTTLPTEMTMNISSPAAVEMVPAITDSELPFDASTIISAVDVVSSVIDHNAMSVDASLVEAVDATGAKFDVDEESALLSSPITHVSMLELSAKVSSLRGGSR